MCEHKAPWFQAFVRSAAAFAAHASTRATRL
jgi:hypothetical protein